MSELAKALLAFQTDAPRLQRDAINPHFRSKFISLEALTEAVLPGLNKQGVVLMQLPTVIDGKPALRTLLVHAESGDSVEDAMLLQASKDDPQGQGSALTYARRYALMAALGLVADEDDDGNAATRSGAGTDATGRENPEVPPQSEAGSTAPDNPAEVARQAQEAAKAARTPNDGGIPENVVIEFGKFKGTALGAIPGDYLEWLATKFDAKNEHQRRVVMAAHTILSATVPDDDLPF